MTTKVKCYGKVREYASQKDAIDFYKRAAICSEGSEQNRYITILLQLMEGKEYCVDEY